MTGDLTEIRDLFGGIVSLAAVIAFLLVLGLYLSQRRDLMRLRAWMESDPGHPSRDLLASEAILDRAEAELAELEAERSGQPISPTTARMPGDRPTLSRITMERQALLPHPRWRRFVGRATQTRVLIALSAVAVVLGVTAILASEKLLEFGSGDPSSSGAVTQASDIQVALLNGTSTSGAAGAVSDVIERRGFDIGRVDTSPEDAEQTQVLFTEGNRADAQRVANVLEIDDVAPAEGEIAARARNADVVVLVGEDRATS